MMGVGAYRRTVRSDELLEELPGGEVGRNGLALPQNVLLPLLLDQHLSRRQEDAVREGNREDVQRVRLSALRKERVLGAVGVLHLVEERGDLLARNIPMLEKNGEMYRML